MALPSRREGCEELEACSEPRKQEWPESGRVAMRVAEIEAKAVRVKTIPSSFIAESSELSAAAEVSSSPAASTAEPADCHPTSLRSIVAPHFEELCSTPRSTPSTSVTAAAVEEASSTTSISFVVPIADEGLEEGPRIAESTVIAAPFEAPSSNSRSAIPSTLLASGKNDRPRRRESPVRAAQVYDNVPSFYENVVNMAKAQETLEIRPRPGKASGKGKKSGKSKLGRQHTESRPKGGGGEASSRAGERYVKLCKFGRKCMNRSCPFQHPEKENATFRSGTHQTVDVPATDAYAWPSQISKGDIRHSGRDYSVRRSVSPCRGKSYSAGHPARGIEHASMSQAFDVPLGHAPVNHHQRASFFDEEYRDFSIGGSAPVGAYNRCPESRTGWVRAEPYAPDWTESSYSPAVNNSSLGVSFEEEDDDDDDDGDDEDLQFGHCQTYEDKYLHFAEQRHGQICDMGWTCDRPNCPYIHEEGRAIDEDDEPYCDVSNDTPPAMFDPESHYAVSSRSAPRTFTSDADGGKNHQWATAEPQVSGEHCGSRTDSQRLADVDKSDAFDDLDEFGESYYDSSTDVFDPKSHYAVSSGLYHQWATEAPEAGHRYNGVYLAHDGQCAPCRGCPNGNRPICPDGWECMSPYCALVHEEGRLIDMADYTPAADPPCSFQHGQRSYDGVSSEDRCSIGICPRGWECDQEDCRLIHEEGRAIEEDWRSDAFVRSAKGDDFDRWARVKADVAPSPYRHDRLWH